MAQIWAHSTDDLSAVIASASPGDHLILTPGHYGGNHVVDKPLVLRSEKAGGTVTFTAPQGSCLLIRAPRTWLWELSFEATSTDAALLTVECDDVGIDNCQLTGGKAALWIHGSRGMDDRYGSNITVNRCTIQQGVVGLHLEQCANVDVTDCIIRDNRRFGVLSSVLDKNVRLVGCEISHNGEAGLSTAYYNVYWPPSGLNLYRCNIHDNGVHGVQVLDSAWYTGVQDCRCYDNGTAQVLLQAEAYVDGCDISGGKVGIAIARRQKDDILGRGPGGNPMIADCTIHDVPVGISASGPGMESDTVQVFRSRISHTTLSGVESLENAKVHLGGCLIRDNALTGVEVHEGSEIDLTECRLTRNRVGVLVRGGSSGRMGESILASNGTAVQVDAGGMINTSRCRIEANGVGLALAKGTTGTLYDTSSRMNTQHNVLRDPLSQVDIVDDPSIDHLAVYMSRSYGKEVRIPDE